ncbi:MAG: hypothetical protein Q8L27_04010 [archaeon]|nr:hypothetical protein [archaeon]
MKIVIHRVNLSSELKKIPREFGVEIDVRGYGNQMLLNHDPLNPNLKYESLEDYLKSYHHSLAVFNMKEAGYEQRVIDLAKEYGIEDYFLLDVEFPYIYRATRKEGFRKIASRYSEAEPIEMTLAQKGLLDWVWIDTNTQIPLNPEVVSKLSGFKTCLVCPSRWGREQDIGPYADKIKQLKMNLDAVMTSIENADKWLKELS